MSRQTKTPALVENLNKQLATDYAGPWKVVEGERIQLFEGGKLVFDVANSTDVRPVLDRLVMALLNEQQLVRRLGAMNVGSAGARAQKIDVLRLIIIDAIAGLAKAPQSSALGDVRRVHRAALREIARRRRADPNNDDPMTPKRATVSERYVRRVTAELSAGIPLPGVAPRPSKGKGRV